MTSITKPDFSLKINDSWDFVWFTSAFPSPKKHLKSSPVFGEGILIYVVFLAELILNIPILLSPLGTYK